MARERSLRERLDDLEKWYTETKHLEHGIVIFAPYWNCHFMVREIKRFMRDQMGLAAEDWTFHHFQKTNEADHIRRDQLYIRFRREDDLLMFKLKVELPSDCTYSTEGYV